MDALRNPSPRTPARPDAGFSLIEALFAALLLVLAAAGLSRAIAASSGAGRAASDTGLAVRIARARLDRLQSAPLRPLLFPGFHPAVAPGGSARVTGSGTPGYVEFFDEDGGLVEATEAFYEVRWQITELTAGGEFDSLRFEVLAMPASGGRGAVVRLDSIRVANRE